jgi:DNA-directed RNA polymerase specialized sigma24 family protein
MEIVMNTSAHRQSYSLYPYKTDAQIQAEFADLVLRACNGDRRAVGAIYVAFGPVLLRKARSVMGPFKEDAEDVVQDFFVSVLEGRSVYVPAQGYAIRWMCGVVLAMAKTYRKEREREWDVEHEP